MNSLELNKVFAAVLTAGIAFMVAGELGKVLVHGERPHESAIKIATAARLEVWHREGVFSGSFFR